MPSRQREQLRQRVGDDWHGATACMEASVPSKRIRAAGRDEARGPQILWDLAGHSKDWASALKENREPVQVFNNNLFFLTGVKVTKVKVTNSMALKTLKMFLPNPTSI